MVLFLFMAMGAMRMSRNRVLTRRAAAIETLGAATTLCTDKTGTLTQNRMRIAELRLPDGRILIHDDRQKLMLEEEFHLLAEFGILASAQGAAGPHGGELALVMNCRARNGQGASGRTLDHHYPLDPALLAMSHVWGNPDPAPERIIATKSAHLALHR